MSCVTADHFFNRLILVDSYCSSIVDEGGASIYSVSDEAQKELPDLDPTLRGAGMLLCVFDSALFYIYIYVIVPFCFLSCIHIPCYVISQFCLIIYVELTEHFVR